MAWDWERPNHLDEYVDRRVHVLRMELRKRDVTLYPECVFPVRVHLYTHWHLHRDSHTQRTRRSGNARNVYGDLNLPGTGLPWRSQGRGGRAMDLRRFHGNSHDAVWNGNGNYKITFQS